MSTPYWIEDFRPSRVIAFIMGVILGALIFSNVNYDCHVIREQRNEAAREARTLNSRVNLYEPLVYEALGIRADDYRRIADSLVARTQTRTTRMVGVRP